MQLQQGSLYTIHVVWSHLMFPFMTQFSREGGHHRHFEESFHWSQGEMCRHLRQQWSVLWRYGHFHHQPLHSVFHMCSFPLLIDSGFHRNVKKIVVIPRTFYDSIQLRVSNVRTFVKQPVDREERELKVFNILLFILDSWLGWTLAQMKQEAVGKNTVFFLNSSPKDLDWFQSHARQVRAVAK